MDFARATDLAQRAVQADRANETRVAIELYTQAVEALVGVLRFEQDEAKRQAIRQAADNYLSRAEELKRETNYRDDASHLLPAHERGGGASISLPPAPTAPVYEGGSGNSSSSGGGHVAPHVQGGGGGGGDASVGELATVVAKGALTGVIAAGVAAKQANDQYKITEKVGTVAVATGTKAMQLNEEYRVTERVADGAKKTVAAAVQIDRDYHVVDKVQGAVKSTVTAAVELDRKHQIHEKVGVCAQAAWVKTKELDSHYKVTENIGKGMLAGLNWTAAKATQALQGRNAAAGGAADAAPI